MDAIVRGLVVYLFLLILFRIAGRRTLGSITNFDFVLLLIISEATQNAMIGNDYSVTNGFLVILTLVGLDIVLSYMKQRFPAMERYLDGLPLILVDQGRPLKDLMHRVRVDEQDILAAAPEKHGWERIDQIRHAILEPNDMISIVPKTG